MKNDHHTKSGPGRTHRQGNGKDKKTSGLFGKGLSAASARKNHAAQKVRPLQDDHGAYTLIGSNLKSTFVWRSGFEEHVGWVPGRRKWLGGISAQRGF